MNTLTALLSHGVAERIGWTLLHSLWEASLIAAGLAIALRLLARSSPQLRYAAACVAMVTMALLPAATGGLLSLPNRNVAASTASISQPQPAPAPAKAEFSRTAAPIVPARALSEPIRERSWRDVVLGRLESIRPYVVCGWLIGVLLLSLRHLLAWTRVQELRRRQIRPVDASLCDRLSSLTRKLGIKRVVRLVESSLVQTPTVIGWLRPMILLPASAMTGLSHDQLEALLLHELAHIRRCDYLVNLMQTMLEILGFYHPAVWWASHRIRIERENCCDDVAAQALGDNLRYARALSSMEDLRAGRPELAMAASGGSLLARIRRLVGQTPTENKSSLWAPILAVAILTFSLAATAGLAAADYYTDPATDLEREVLKGFAENRAKFTCGTLAWTRETEDNGFAGLHIPIPQGGVKYGGQHRMWWDGDKIATKWTIEGLHSSREPPPGPSETSWQGKDRLYYWIGRTEGSNIYKGGLLAREPRWRPYENWFSSVIRWRGRASLDKRILEGGRMKHMAVEWSAVEVDGARLIRRVAKNIDAADVSCGEYSLEHYDPAKGHGLVREEWYMPDGVRRVNHTVRLEQVIPGGWFPVENIVEFANIQDGSILRRQRMALDLAQCRFNDKSALPRGIFEALPRQEQDELRQVLGEIIRKQTTDQPADAETKTQGPRASVEGFLAAALKGDYGAAAAFAHPRQPLDDLKEFKELLTGQDVRVVAVFAADEAALAVTSAIRADHGQAGPLTFQLVKSANPPTPWLIEDIDIETPQEAGTEVERFLRAHPAATAFSAPD
jgi:beta-lactamase regulating signal transducer with metallopeptidase domain